MFCLLSLLLLFASSVSAGTIQYLVATGHVTQVSDRAIAPAAGYGLITLEASIDAMVWPVPPGCHAGEALWTRVVDPATVTSGGTGLAVQPALVFFRSAVPAYAGQGCAEVRSAAQLWELVNLSIGTSYHTHVTLPVLSELSVLAMSLCPPTIDTANCQAVRASMALLIPATPEHQMLLVQVLQEAVALRAEAQAFMTAQGWGAPR